MVDVNLVAGHLFSGNFCATVTDFFMVNAHPFPVIPPVPNTGLHARSSD